MTFPLTKGSAIEVVSRIMKEEQSEYDLVQFDQFRKRTKLRSERYDSFLVLCLKNTYKSTGWLVCRYIMTNGCKLSSGLLTFNSTSGGTGRLQRHAKLHELHDTARINFPRPLPAISKTKVARGAALAVAFDLRPISFTDQKKGMRSFVDAVFRAGQELPVNDPIDPSSILPSATCVTKALQTIAENTREEYKELIMQKMYETGGGVTTDGVTLKVQDRQFQDLTVHFLEVKGSTRINEDPKVEMKVATLLLKEKPVVGDAATIRAMLGTYLLRHYDRDIDWLTSRFTMVTDYASVMARVALSSVSTNVAPMSERWMGCLAHQLNTAMKCCIGSLDDDCNLEMQRIFDDLQLLKKLVRIFKQSGWNGQLPTGYHLIQECETRFGTTLTLAKRFLKSVTKVEAIIEKKNSNPAKDAFAGILKDNSGSGSLRIPAIEAVVDAFQVVVDAQTKVQAANSPTVHIALPLFQNCLDELERIADGGTIWREDESAFFSSTPYSRKLCRSLLEYLNAKVTVHDLWLVGCYLHPLMREFQFISSMDRRAEYKNRAQSMVRSLINSYTGSVQTRTDDVQCSPENDSISAGRFRDTSTNTTLCYNQTNVPGRKRTFSLMKYADSHFHPTTFVDEVSRYNVIDVSVLGIDKEKFMDDDFAAVKFWYRRKGTFPNMFKVVCRVYATPVSSCASERVFSALNRIVSRDRASTSAETLEDIIVIRSMLQ